ncbi:prepilin-type N-terminal cleavage/methylation domain-containing protein [Candidatus Pelagibacter sp.]|nr:prepilin-type N-terminal cleavage/methylation domain-containing protein [Candidatus Pelagibacter sp.]
MKKTLQKGFSLVELLVVVAIIGVLAGVGIVGYQSYTDSAKSRVAVANFNSVKRFVETELTLLNNNIQTVSGAISAGTDCASVTPYTVYSQSLGNFVEGLTCYFATDGYGNAFKNPYDAAGGNQVVYNLAAASVKKGQINIKHFATDNTTVNGAVIPSGGLFAAASTSGYFLVEYYTADGTAGSTGEYKAKEFQLK